MLAILYKKGKNEDDSRRQVTGRSIWLRVRQDDWRGKRGKDWLRECWRWPSDSCAAAHWDIIECFLSPSVLSMMPFNPTSSGPLTQVAGRLHVEVMRVTGAVPERVVEDDSSENSSESGSLEVVDSSGEVIHRVKKLTCRVRGQ